MIKASTFSITNEERAQGCLLGQLAGDGLGSLAEFQSPEEIRRKYQECVRDLADGGTWNTVGGQPTDDSKMRLLLVRMFAERGTYVSSRGKLEFPQERP
jgi:ADP-ribosylglycohydrolase